MLSSETITREFGDSETGTIIKNQIVRIDLKTIRRNVFFVRQQEDGLIVGSILKKVKGFIPVWWDNESARWRVGQYISRDQSTIIPCHAEEERGRLASFRKEDENDL